MASRWAPLIAKNIAADKARGWHNRVSLGARIQMEMAQREVGEPPRPIGEYCLWPLGRPPDDEWDILN